MQSKNECTVVILGARNTGKTEIVEYYVFGAGAKKSRPTIEDMYQKQLADGRILSIIDTSGEESTIDNLRQLYSTVADAYIIMFNIDDKKTCCRAKREYEYVCEFKKPIIVVATYVGNAPENIEKKRLLFKNACFFCINLLEKQNCAAIFETAAANIQRPKKKKFTCFCC